MRAFVVHCIKHSGFIINDVICVLNATLFVGPFGILLRQTCVVMCIPNTFLFQYVEARVNARGRDHTSVALLVQGVER